MSGYGGTQTAGGESYLLFTGAGSGGGGSSHGPGGTTFAIGQDGPAGPPLPPSVTITYTPPGPLDHLTVSPATASIAAGGSQDFTAEGFDAQNIDLGDVTGDTAFGIGPDGSCAGATCSATTTGAHTVTATDGAASGTATLTGTAGGARSVSASGGTPQTATIDRAFANPLQATVTDACGNVVAGVDVTFTAPASSPSGAFADASTATVTTDANGVCSCTTSTRRTCNTRAPCSWPSSTG